MFVPGPVFDRMVALRRDLHRHPELSWQEHRSMAAVCRELESLGIAYRSGVAGTGIVAEIEGSRPGPRVALRADLDALPLHEETGLAFASTIPGVMHACGHDGHTAMLLGAAAMLAADPPPGPVRLIWQPGEEHGNGAQAMMQAGALDDVSVLFGGHIDPRYPAGALIVTDGAVNASTDDFRFVVRGRSGHGARPHETIDAIVVASLVVVALQTVVSRLIDPSEPAVVSVGRFDAGVAPNVIAGRAVLEGTIRSQDPEVRIRLREAVVQVARTAGSLHGAVVEAEVTERTPVLVNAGPPLALARQAALEVVGPERVLPLRSRNMGGEDFAWYLSRVPGAYVRFGARVEGRSHAAHSTRFEFHEDALGVGAAWYDRVARIGR